MTEYFITVIIYAEYYSRRTDELESYKLNVFNKFINKIYIKNLLI